MSLILETLQLVGGLIYLFGTVKADDEKEAKLYNIPESVQPLKLVKVNEDDLSVTISGVKFRLRHKKFGWIQITGDTWKFVDNENDATWIATDSNGEINIPNAPIGNWEWREDLNSRPYGYDPADPDRGEFTITEDEKDNVCEVKVKNKQKWVKLSGFVWLDDSGSKSGDAKDNNNLFKTPNDGTDASDLLFDGIQVRLMDKTTGTLAKDKNGNELVTTTGYVDRTEEEPGYLETEGHNGHGQYLFVDVEIAKLQDYYIEFTYDGLNYTNVLSYNDENVSKVNPWPNNASKAAESEQDRTNLNEKYAIINNDGAYNPGGEKTINLGDDDYDVTTYEEGDPRQISTYTGYRDSNYDYDYENSLISVNSEQLDLNNVPYSIQANTNETGYKLKTGSNISQETDGFQWGKREVQYINLGLKTRDKPYIELGKDIDNVEVSINGKNHSYQYSSRYNDEDPTEEDSNVGVKFKDNFSGDYLQAVYRADYNYVSEDSDNELKVYVTYDLNMIQHNQNLQANVNSIVDYFDQTYVREGAEYEDYIRVYYKETDENGQETETEITDWHVDDNSYANNKYKKLIINNNTRLDQSNIKKHIFITFQLSREQIKMILSDKITENEKTEGERADEILNNVAEINSYSILENGEYYAAVDQYSRPENCDPEDESTFEQDTSSSPGLQLEVANAREMKGTVFIDNHEIQNSENPENPDGIMTGLIRQGDGIYDEEKETTVNDVIVEIREANINTGTGEVTPGEIVQVFAPDANDNEEDENKWKDSTTKTGENNVGAGKFSISNYIPGDYVITYTWGGQTYTYTKQDGKTEDKTITVQDYKGTIYPEKERQNHTDETDSDRWWNGSIDEQGNETSDSPDYKRYTDAIDDYQTRKQIDEQIQRVTKDTNDTINNAYSEEKEDNNETITTMISTTPLMKIGVEFASTFSAELTESKFVYCINDIDFGIIERAKQELALKKRINKMKVTLANGQVIADLTVEDGKLTGEHKNVTYMKPDDNQEPKSGFIRLELDNELIQGTKLEVEYEITVTNNSELDYIPNNENDEPVFYKYGEIENQKLITMSPTGIIEYLDKNWSFDNNLNENNKKWEVKTVEDIKDLVIKDVYDATNQKTTIGEKMILYTSALEKEKLEPNGFKQLSLNVSKILTTTDEISLSNEIEEVEITRTGGPRPSSTPGHYVPGTVPKESDEDQAETAIVTPATGEDLNYIVPIIIGTTALIILGAGIIIIKKKVI